LALAARVALTFAMRLVLILLLWLDVQFSLLIKRVGLLLLPEDWACIWHPGFALFEIGTDTPAVASRMVFPSQLALFQGDLSFSQLLVRDCLFDKLSYPNLLISQLTFVARSHSTICHLWTR